MPFVDASTARSFKINCAPRSVRLPSVRIMMDESPTISSVFATPSNVMPSPVFLSWSTRRTFPGRSSMMTT